MKRYDPPIDYELPIKSTLGQGCRICGSTDNLTEHHLVTKAKMKELKISEGKTVTLCQLCHILFHSRKPKRGNIRSMLRDNLTAFEIGYIVRVAGNEYLKRLYPNTS